MADTLELKCKQFLPNPKTEIKALKAPFLGKYCHRPIVM